MRREEEMMELILRFGQEHDDIRVTILNGSRANPNARRDPFQDYDVACYVRNMEPFIRNMGIVRYFGEILILQLPDDMGDPPPADKTGYGYLMQFMDGNRIDLGFQPLGTLSRELDDSLTVVLLDKDNRVGPRPPSSDRGYFPKPPSAQQYHDCCNEFWWMTPYAAKGLWRDELTYAKQMMDGYVRQELMKMMYWYFGVQTNFQKSPGKLGKYLQGQIDPGLWSLLEQTYADASYENTWEALFVMGDLFRTIARPVGDAFGFPYHEQEDANVSQFIRRIRALPKDAQSI